MVVTVDMIKEYHPYSIMLTKTEGSEDYAYMCLRLKELAIKIGGNNFNPTILLADAAPETANGYQAVITLGYIIFQILLLTPKVPPSLKLFTHSPAV